MTDRPGRTLASALLAFAVIVAVVVRDAANENGGASPETAVALPAFVADGPPRHDPGDAVVLESAERLDSGEVQLTGWAVATDRVEVLADGRLIGSLPITEERVDVAAEQDLPGVFAGFDGRVALGPERDPAIICVARPDQLPGMRACDQPAPDLRERRLVAFYGVPYAPPLGTLGDGEPDAVLRRLIEQAEPYATPDRPVTVGFEVIATVAQYLPGDDGDYSHPIPVEDIWTFLRTIREVDGVLLIDFQTGRDTYLDQVPQYLDLLAEPDVHIALDPEWDMEEGQVPNQVIGSSDATEINEVMELVADVIRENRLPRKLVIVHNFDEIMITGRELLDPPPEVDLVIHMDGHGSPELKIGVYNRLAADPPFFNGFKLFYQRDVPLMSPEEVLRILDPDLITYQ